MDFLIQQMEEGGILSSISLRNKELLDKIWKKDRKNKKLQHCQIFVSLIAKAQGNSSDRWDTTKTKSNKREDGN